MCLIKLTHLIISYLLLYYSCFCIIAFLSDLISTYVHFKI